MVIMIHVRLGAVRFHKPVSETVSSDMPLAKQSSWFPSIMLKSE